MDKILSPRTISVAVGFGIGALLMGACGNDTNSVPSPDAVTSAANQPHIKAEYYSNGTRILRYENEDGYYADIFQACDGPDLVEQTAFLKYGYGAAGNSVERSVGHAACVDGTLTEDDFKTGSRR